MVLAKHSQGMEAVVARRQLSGKPCARQMGHEEMPISFRLKTRDRDEMEMRENIDRASRIYLLGTL